MPVTLLDGRIAETSLRPGEFVKQNAPGPYTSLVVHKNGTVPFWKEHVQRLHESLAARCNSSSAKTWVSVPWRLKARGEEISHLDLASNVQEAAHAVRELQGRETDASVIICISEERG